MIAHSSKLPARYPRFTIPGANRMGTELPMRPLIEADHALPGNDGVPQQGVGLRAEDQHMVRFRLD
jgi:hypothetical protein